MMVMVKIEGLEKILSLLKREGFTNTDWEFEYDDCKSINIIAEKDELQLEINLRVYPKNGKELYISEEGFMSIYMPTSIEQTQFNSKNELQEILSSLKVEV